jgi:hypothetical protein
LLHLSNMRFLTLSILSAFIFLALTASLILFYLFPGRNETMINFLDGKCKTCVNARALAGADFEQGTYRVIRVGLPEQNIKRDLIASILKADYNIDTFHAGCVGTEEMDCYTETMAGLLLQKYGADFYDKVKAKAEEQYKLLAR